MKVENQLNPKKEQMTSFLEGDPNAAIYMLNLLKFKHRAEYTDGRETSLTGEQAYAIYIKEIEPHIQKVGGESTFVGDISRLMVGEVEDLWDKVVIVKYPSRMAMIKASQDPDYQKCAIHRIAGLEGQLDLELNDNPF